MRTAHHDPVARSLAAGALLASIGALLMSMSGIGQAQSANQARGATAQLGLAPLSARPVVARPAAAHTATKRKPTKHKPTKPTKHKPTKPTKPTAKPTTKPTATVVATANYANNAGMLGGVTLAALSDGCPAGSVAIGTWCLDAALYQVPGTDAGKNNYFYATQACEAKGGYLPSAAQLIGAAPIVALASTLTDSQSTAITDAPVAGQPEPDTGYHDMREMSSTLFTTTAGDDAAGSEGVSVGSTGDPLTGQPNPTPEPSDPDPSTLDYVTVYDNGNAGGFAGGEWVGAAENFRCAYDKVQGSSAYGEG